LNDNYLWDIGMVILMLILDAWMVIWDIYPLVVFVFQSFEYLWWKELLSLFKKGKNVLIFYL